MRALIALAVLLSPPVSQAAAADIRVRATLTVERWRTPLFRARYSVTNVTRNSLGFVYSDAQQYDFVLSDEGRELWRWSADKALAQVAWGESLEPGESIFRTEVDLDGNGRIGFGDFFLFAFILRDHPRRGVGT